MKPRNKALLLVLIAILVGYQAVVSWTSYILPTASRAWDLRNEPAWARAGVMLVGDWITGHLGFLKQSLPEEARVVLPPHSGGGVYEHIGFIQYFLIPRDIINCGPNEVEACIR